MTANGGEGMRTKNAAPSLQAEEAATTIQKAAAGMKHLPLDEFFVETDAAMNEATPLPWVWGQHSEPTAEELAAWAATCVGKRDGATMQMAVVDDPETGAESYLQTAMFGNGPRSAANAQFAIAAVNNYPTLRDIIRDRDATIATLRKALPTWIPVEERLPGEAQRVVVRIVFNSFGDDAEAFGQWYGDDDGWLIEGETDATTADPLVVTHWMPLPDPPAALDEKGA